MSSSAPSNVSFTQAQDLQRQLESIILKMEKADLLRETAGDHIRVIVAEGIAQSFGDRYRVYPSAPRPDKLPIRRDSVPNPCVLAVKAATNKKTNSSKVAGLDTATNDTSSPSKTAGTTSRGETGKISAWAAGVANASPASSSPEKSITYDARLAANASRWDAILDNPITLSPSALRGSYGLSGKKAAKRTVCSSPAKDGSIANHPVPVKAAAVKKVPTRSQLAMNNTTAGTRKKEDSDLSGAFETFLSTPPRATPPKAITAPKTITIPKTTNTSDWLIDLSP